jgi:hypothetical protein
MKTSHELKTLHELMTATMKKLFSVLVIFCWLTLPLHSQPGPEPQGPAAGRIETMKINFITNRLHLTPQEAQRFWPIYRFYSAEKRQAYLVYRNNGNELERQETMLNIRKKYSVEFLKALSPGKINDFFKAENEFETTVILEIRRRQMQGRQF